MRLWLNFVLVAVFVGLAGCAGRPAAPPPPTTAEIAVTTAGDMNPGADGKPTAAVVRVFRLAAPERFQRADYGDLFEKDEATLGADLIGTVDILIEPGMSERFDRTLGPRDRWLGFVVTYHDAESAHWRSMVPLAAGEKTIVEVEVGARGVMANTVEETRRAAVPPKR